MTAPYTASIVQRLIDYETGNMESEEEQIEFFQSLIDNGLAWELQGSYGRLAHALIDNGYCHNRAA